MKTTPGPIIPVPSRNFTTCRPSETIRGRTAIQGVLDRAHGGAGAFEEWDDWLDGDEHSDSDADDDDGD
ncbi:MAG TPA: hypothetical protein DCQ94_07440 [Nitrospira sp.]|nr:hypothetical protein [Nitrospira sp.]